MAKTVVISRGIHGICQLCRSPCLWNILHSDTRWIWINTCCFLCWCIRVKDVASAHVTLQAETRILEQSLKSCQVQVLKFHFKVRFGFLLCYLRHVKSFSSSHSFSTLSNKPNSLVLTCNQPFLADSPVILFASLSCLQAALLALQLSLHLLFSTNRLWSDPVLKRFHKMCTWSLLLWTVW